jgi:cytochrome c-type biogenesis protein CcsB
MQTLKAYAEHVYNRYCNTAPLAYTSLTLGLLSFFCLLRRKLTKFRVGFSIASAIIFIGISAIIGIRAFISGRFPMSNGYETMLFISWISFAATIFAGIKIPLVMPAGFFIGGFALLVSKLGMMNPEITPLMPVLASPWMSIHVTLMMLSYTFFAFMAFNSAATLVMARNRAEHQDTISRLVLLNRFLLYPSTFMLAIGMFIGAVWANESWGSYWSWDPKETWALITMIVYAMAFHRESISWMKRDLYFQTYLLVCFGSIIMTYFGVNYLLGGMHSYAG